MPGAAGKLFDQHKGGGAPPTPITYRGSIFRIGTTTSVSITQADLSAASLIPASGDLLFFVAMLIGTGGSKSPNNPSARPGTALVEETAGQGNSSKAIYYKVSTGTGDGTYTLTLPSALTTNLVMRAVLVGGPGRNYDVAHVAGPTSAVTTINVATTSPTLGNGFAIATCSADGNPTLGLPAGYTSIAQDDITGESMKIGYQTGVTGATGTLAFTRNTSGILEAGLYMIK